MSEAAYEKKQYALTPRLTLKPLESGQTERAGKILASPQSLVRY